MADKQLARHHYIPVVALQHLSVLFCLAQACRTTSPALAVSALVHEPVRVLSSLSLTLLLPQVWFGNWSRLQRIALKKDSKPAQASSSKLKRARERPSAAKLIESAKQGKLPPLPSFDVNFLARAAAFTPPSILLVHFLIVMLGAPFTSYASETALLACLITVLAFVPVFVAIPQTEPFAYTRLLSSLSNLDDVQTILVYPAVGVIAGAYIGSFAIPLDWDRPWQKWPTTCVLGALAGHPVGAFAAIIRLAQGRSMG